ncbi:putative dehydrogenase [Arthrobacter sp. B2I5]|uniref:Gfo/Idh/MocA family protein n=1 Tax=Arthrobacter sp. B2I5 TaxID=3042266 RepID=UPI0027820D6E|nr:Gfo/Idh/MocA family oxidoreductase [Arthrobacter sp. B2I5]MDQ0827968.1 putative dehydrogenase [Arthrobacter sp. B2I5]
MSNLPAPTENYQEEDEMNAVAHDYGVGKEPVARLRMAVVGAGSRGASLARAFHACPEWELTAVCDVEIDRAGKLAAQLGDVPWFETIDELLDSVEVDTAAIATPLGALHGTTMTALRAGKHVLAEEPLADSLVRGHEMVSEAQANGLVLMTDHPHSFEPAIQKIQKLMDSGSLGEILFVEALLSEPNLLKTERDVFWDLAPGNFAILDQVLPEGLAPLEVSAFGGDPLGTGRDCVGHINFRLSNDAPVHVHVNRLSRAKTHQLLIAGTRLTMVWDGGLHKERLQVLDPCLPNQQKHFSPYCPEPEIPQLLDEDGPQLILEQQTLGRMAAELAKRIQRQRGGFPPHLPGLRVLAMLEAIARSRSIDGQASRVMAPFPEDSDPDIAGNWSQSILWSK